MKKLLTILSIFVINLAYSQINIGGSSNKNFSLNYSEPREFEIGGISVKGVNFLDENALISLTGLKVGDKLNIPGDRLSTAIKKLWDSNLFSSIDVYLAKVEGNKAYLEINLIDLPELNEIDIQGVKKGKIEELKKETLYNRVRITPIPTAEDYLEGLEVISLDYKQLFEKYKDCESVVFLIDPPYLSTDCSTYASDNYWRLTDYLDVLKVLHDQNYFYFTSNKSSIIELCEWIGNNTGAVNPFNKAEIKTHFTTMNQTSSYTDMMLFKWTKTTTNE